MGDITGWPIWLLWMWYIYFTGPWNNLKKLKLWQTSYPPQKTWPRQNFPKLYWKTTIRSGKKKNIERTIYIYIYVRKSFFDSVLYPDYNNSAELTLAFYREFVSGYEVRHFYKLFISQIIFNPHKPWQTMPNLSKNFAKLK